MCKIIVPAFRRRWWNLLETTNKQSQLRKYFLVSNRFSCGFKEMSSTEGDSKSSNLFQGTKDRFNGVVVKSANETCPLQCFPSTLEESLKVWSTNNVRTVWFSVSLEQADWIPVLAKNGFKFHHTAGDDVVMYKWLPKTEDCNIPPYAHTMVGVGAVVINSEGEILTIKERFPGVSQWKLPGGYVDPGENIPDAAVREVLEETNIQTQFQFLACFRHMHNANFGCSDIYFIASLKPLSAEIRKCNREIDACVWMKVAEFLEHPQVHQGNKTFVQACLQYQREGSSIGCVQSMHAIINRPQCVYSIMENKDIPEYKPKNVK